MDPNTSKLNPNAPSFIPSKVPVNPDLFKDVELNTSANKGCGAPVTNTTTTKKEAPKVVEKKVLNLTGIALKPGPLTMAVTEPSGYAALRTLQTAVITYSGSADLESIKSSVEAIAAMLDSCGKSAFGDLVRREVSELESAIAARKGVESANGDNAPKEYLLKFKYLSQIFDEMKDAARIVAREASKLLVKGQNESDEDFAKRKEADSTYLQAFDVQIKGRDEIKDLPKALALSAITGDLSKMQGVLSGFMSAMSNNKDAELKTFASLAVNFKVEELDKAFISTQAVQQKVTEEYKALLKTHRDSFVKKLESMASLVKKWGRPELAKHMEWVIAKTKEAIGELKDRTHYIPNDFQRFVSLMHEIALHIRKVKGDSESPEIFQSLYYNTFSSDTQEGLTITQHFTMTRLTEYAERMHASMQTLVNELYYLKGDDKKLHMETFIFAKLYTTVLQNVDSVKDLPTVLQNVDSVKDLQGKTSQLVLAYAQPLIAAYKDGYDAATANNVFLINTLRNINKSHGKDNERFAFYSKMIGCMTALLEKEKAKELWGDNVNKWNVALSAYQKVCEIYAGSHSPIEELGLNAERTEVPPMSKLVSAFQGMLHLVSDDDTRHSLKDALNQKLREAFENNPEVISNHGKKLIENYTNGDMSKSALVQ